MLGAAKLDDTSGHNTSETSETNGGRKGHITRYDTKESVCRRRALSFFPVLGTLHTARLNISHIALALAIGRCGKRNSGVTAVHALLSHSLVPCPSSFKNKQHTF